MKEIWYERNPPGLYYKYFYKHECYIIADLCDEIVDDVGNEVDLTGWEKEVRLSFM